MLSSGGDNGLGNNVRMIPCGKTVVLKTNKEIIYKYYTNFIGLLKHYVNKVFVENQNYRIYSLITFCPFCFLRHTPALDEVLFCGEIIFL